MLIFAVIKNDFIKSAYSSHLTAVRGAREWWMDKKRTLLAIFPISVLRVLLRIFYEDGDRLRRNFY